MVAVEQLTNGHVKINGAVIRVSAGGALVCSIHPGKTFCSEIKIAVEEHYDAELLGPPEAELTNLIITVPLVPARQQWTRVKIGEFHEGTLAYKLYLWESKDKHYDFLGFLQKGEGRSVIRSMIYDWFRSNIDVVSLRCSSTSHGFKQELQWNQNTGPKAQSVEQFAEFWSVWSTKMCLSCSNVLTSLDDLVPDASSNSVRSPW